MNFFSNIFKFNKLNNTNIPPNNTNITKYNGYPDFKLRPFSPTSPSTWEMYNECDHNQYIIDKSSFVTIDLSSDNE